jgi:hypothetical protein
MDRRSRLTTDECHECSQPSGDDVVLPAASTHGGSSSMKPNSAFSVNLVLHDYCRGWIIEKMAFRLCEALCELGVDATVSARPSAESTINHFMIFHYVQTQPDTINTMSVTHVDDALKIDMVREQLSKGVRAAICMSSMTMDQLAGYGIDVERLTYALPAHDCTIFSRRIVVGITSNNPSDGRKRDWLLRRLSEDVPLGDFEFRIFGRGWDKICDVLTAARANVVVKEPSGNYLLDYDEIKAAIPNFDYYFYPGLDEGSLGTIDALSAGVKTIITAQGFHLDIPNGITHAFWEYDELKKIFEDIVHDRRGRVEAARSLTWARHARRHLDIWSSLIERDTLPSCDALGARIEGLANRRYPVKGYFALLGNRHRREMTLRFWVPEIFEWYLRNRHRVGAMVRQRVRAR